MENSIKLIRIPLIMTGVDIFNESNGIRDTIFRLITYFSLISLTISFFYASDFDKQSDFSDRIFILTGIQAFIIVVIQLTYFWNHRDKFISIFEEIKDLHKAREEQWVQVHSEPLFGKSSKFLYKLCK